MGYTKVSRFMILCSVILSSEKLLSDEKGCLNDGKHYTRSLLYMTRQPCFLSRLSTSLNLVLTAISMLDNNLLITLVDKPFRLLEISVKLYMFKK